MINHRSVNWAKTVPEYETLQTMLVESIGFSSEAEISCLELGLGAGATTQKIIEKFPQVIYTGLDADTESLEDVGEILTKKNIQHQLINDTFEKLESNKLFDVIISSLAIHHLNSPIQLELFEKIHSLLQPGGIFMMADLFMLEDPELQRIASDSFKQYRRNNLSPEESAAFTQHCNETNHSFNTYAKTRDMLRVAGFKHVDMVWNHLSLSVVRATTNLPEWMTIKNNMDTLS